MNRDQITVQDCLDNAELKGLYAVINDGEVLDFVPESGAEK